jgi:hypothetical protein
MGLILLAISSCRENMLAIIPAPPPTPPFYLRTRPLRAQHSVIVYENYRSARNMVTLFTNIASTLPTQPPCSQHSRIVYEKCVIVYEHSLHARNIASMFTNNEALFVNNNPLFVCNDPLFVNNEAFHVKNRSRFRKH